MKIKPINKKPDLVQFGFLNPGEILRYGNAYYMVIPTFYEKNAVYLGNETNNPALGNIKGTLIKFDYECGVFPCPEAELIVRKFELKDPE